MLMHKSFSLAQEHFKIVPLCWFSVGVAKKDELPQLKWHYGKALPTSNGAIFLLGKTFYRLTCTSLTCTWTKMHQETQYDGGLGTVMYLPASYSCGGKWESPYFFVVNNSLCPGALCFEYDGGWRPDQWRIFLERQCWKCHPLRQ